jgi:sulfur-carrier protein
VERVRVLLPRSLQAYWEGGGSVEVEGRDLGEVLAALSRARPGLAERVLDDQGRVRRHVLVFVNQEAVGHLAPASVPVRDGDVVHILPAVSGGSHGRQR